jgi:hypothetical protein
MIRNLFIQLNFLINPPLYGFSIANDCTILYHPLDNRVDSCSREFFNSNELYYSVPTIYKLFGLDVIL